VDGVQSCYWTPDIQVQCRCCLLVEWRGKLRVGGSRDRWRHRQVLALQYGRAEWATDVLTKVVLTVSYDWQWEHAAVSRLRVPQKYHWSTAYYRTHARVVADEYSDHPSLWFCLSVRTVKPKRLKLKSPNLAHHIRSKAKGQGHRVTKRKNIVSSCYSHAQQPCYPSVAVPFTPSYSRIYGYAIEWPAWTMHFYRVTHVLMRVSVCVSARLNPNG